MDDSFRKVRVTRSFSEALPGSGFLTSDLIFYKPWAGLRISADPMELHCLLAPPRADSSLEIKDHRLLTDDLILFSAGLENIQKGNEDIEQMFFILVNGK